MTRHRLFSISNTGQLAALLKMSPGEINHIVSRLDQEYFRRPRKKPDGSERILFVPSEKLKLLQRKIYDNILSKVPLLPCVMGGVKGKSPIENAAIHTNQEVIFKMDIAQCFPSVCPRRVQAVFQRFRHLLQRIIEDEGFKVKPDKTKTELAKDRQTVTNFVVNTKVNLPREKRSAIKKEVMTACSSDLELPPSTAGKMYWLRAVNPEVGTRLVKKALDC
jgi:hypothetical protein